MTELANSVNSVAGLVRDLHDSSTKKANDALPLILDKLQKCGFNPPDVAYLKDMKELFAPTGTGTSTGSSNDSYLNQKAQDLLKQAADQMVSTTKYIDDNQAKVELDAANAALSTANREIAKQNEKKKLKKRQRESSNQPEYDHHANHTNGMWGRRGFADFSQRPCNDRSSNHHHDDRGFSTSFADYHDRDFNRSENRGSSFAWDRQRGARFGEYYDRDSRLDENRQSDDRDYRRDGSRQRDDRDYRRRDDRGASFDENRQRDNRESSSTGNNQRDNRNASFDENRQRDNRESSSAGNNQRDNRNASFDGSRQRQRDNRESSSAENNQWDDRGASFDEKRQRDNRDFSFAGNRQRDNREPSSAGNNQQDDRGVSFDENRQRDYRNASFDENRQRENPESSSAENNECLPPPNLCDYSPTQMKSVLDRAYLPKTITEELFAANFSGRDLMNLESYENVVSNFEGSADWENHKMNIAKLLNIKRDLAP